MRCAAVAIAACGLFLAPPARGGEEALYEKIEKAIEKGVEYLKGCQKDDGSFGNISSETLYGGGTGEGYPHRAGLTALALYTLLKCGVKPEDPVIRRGFLFIDTLDKTQNDPTKPPKEQSKYLSTYELSAMVLALEARYNPIKKESIRVTLEKTKAASKNRRLKRLPPVVMPVPDRERMQDWVDRILRRPNPRGWRYNMPGDGMTGITFHEDMSSTQFVLLALRAASHCHGIQINRAKLLPALEFILEQQDADGPAYEVPLDRDGTPHGPGQSVQTVSGKVRGFPYNRNSETRHERVSTGSMTTAGCANCIILKELLAQDPVFRRQWAVKTDQAIRDAVMWVERHWSMKGNPRSGSYFYYYLYGLERVGDLQGTLKIGDHYWYNEGAEVLVKDQRENGAWQRPDTHFPQDVLNTCFALLFLDRATPPIQVSGS